VAVPTSAVTVEGGRATVTVLEDGKPSDVTVQTGAVGEVWTEITDGLAIGQTVVLADLDAPLPTSATDTQITGGFGGPGGVGGFGGFGGLEHLARAESRPDRAKHDPGTRAPSTALSGSSRPRVN
jgi:hypothetical protein